MPTVNMLEAKSSLSRLVQEIQDGVHTEVIIARNGRPAAKLVALTTPPGHAKRLGIAKGKFKVPASIDLHNAEVSTLFLGQSK